MNIWFRFKLWIAARFAIPLVIWSEHYLEYSDRFVHEKKFPPGTTVALDVPRAHRDFGKHWRVREYLGDGVYVLTRGDESSVHGLINARADSMVTVRRPNHAHGIERDVVSESLGRASW